MAKARQPRLTASVHTASPGRTSLRKRVLDILRGDDEEQQKRGAPEGVVPPPYPPAALASLWEASSSLRQNIDAYVTNIDALGYRFEAAIDLNAPDAYLRVQDLLLIEATQAGANGHEPALPSKEEVQARIEILRRQARVELQRLRRFFASCCPEGTFTTLRKQTRQDYEITGNAYWEILRTDGKPVSLSWVPAISMRIGKGGPDYRVVTVQRRVGDLQSVEVKQRRPFHRYAQIAEDTGFVEHWFKQYGDPRTMSRKTGAVFEDAEEMAHKEGAQAKPATEILHFRLSAPHSPYGIPRWVGNMIAVLGSRELDELNHAYFKSNSIPPLALLVAGGRFGKDVQERLKAFFEEEVRGRGAAHRLVILEAEASQRAQGPAIVPKVQFVPLRSSQLQDALFQGYDVRNIEKVGSSFRLPPALRGAGDANRAGMLSALRFAEEQVFQAERESFDAAMTDEILSALSTQFWSFKTNAPVTRDPETLGQLIVDLVRVGAVTPAEARELIEPLFGRQLAPIHEAWANRPMPITLAQLQVRASPAEAVREGRRADGATAADEPDIVLAELSRRPEEAAILQVPSGAAGLPALPAAGEEEGGGDDADAG